MKGKSHGDLQISRTFMNLLNIWGLWSRNLLDSWGLWSTNLQDIRKSPGYLGPIKCWIFWACMIKCSQFAKGKLFFGLATPKIHSPLCYQNQRGKNFRHSLYFIFIPGIALESWKILSGNFLFLELKNPGKFCPGRKLSWNFLKIIYIFPGIYSSGIFHSWNFPFLEFCPGTFCYWNLISRNFLATRWKKWKVFQVFTLRCHTDKYLVNTLPTGKDDSEKKCWSWPQSFK